MEKSQIQKKLIQKKIEGLQWQDSERHRCHIKKLNRFSKSWKKQKINRVQPTLIQNDEWKTAKPKIINAGYATTKIPIDVRGYEREINQLQSALIQIVNWETPGTEILSAAYATTTILVDSGVMNVTLNKYNKFAKEKQMWMCYKIQWKTTWKIK